MVDKKNKIVFLLILFSIISFSFGIYYKIKYDELEYGECWLWVKDEDGNGFGDVINHCKQTKINCESLNHNIPCKWIEGKILVDTEGKTVGRITEGCECKIL